jgi:hypothetical protein
MLTQLQGDRKVWPDIDDRLSDVGPRHRHDTLPRRYHLPDIGTYGRDHSGEIGFYLRVTKLLERLGEVCLRASD